MITTVIIWIFTIGYALSVAYCITIYLVKKSNDFGDSKGKYEDFMDRPFIVKKRKDNVTMNYPFSIKYK